MNQLLQDKITQLKIASDFECWYLVRHSTNFGHLCYLVSFLKDYVEHPGSAVNVEKHIENKAAAINTSKPSLGLSNNYRALRVAAFFGLIKMTSSKYEECIFTDTYNEVLARCNGDFEKTELYQDIINRQIEKMFVSSSIDEGQASNRREYAIFPIMFLNKVLVELGKATGSFSITMNEYRYLIATTKKFEDYLETMLYIKLLRDEPSANIQLEELRGKYDNRMNKAIELLDYLDFSNNKIAIKDACVDSISKKVFQFEKLNLNMTDAEYINFLCSTKSLFDAEFEKKEIININQFTPEWFNEKGKEFVAEDVDAKFFYDAFKDKYAPDKLSAYSGEDLLNAMFLGGNSDNLCHDLEYVKKNAELFGSVKSGTAFKYPLFKRNETWMSGTSHNPIELTLDEAIIKGTSVRDGLVNGYNTIQETLPLETVEDYLALYTKLYKIIPDLVDSLWVIKYYHMMFPELIPVWYNKDWQLKVLSVLKKEPNDTAYGRLGQINLFVKECDISNVVFSKVFHKYCRNVEVQLEDDIIEDTSFDRLTGGENIILYGVPGAGKSWTIKHEYCDDDSCIERLVFHPDYTYSDFVGQIMPKVSEEGIVSYEFTPGPFTKLVRRAYLNPEKMFYLVIEEVNRGNAPAIFGDVFQLLDRQAQYIEDENNKLVENQNYGASEYEITNADVARTVYKNENHKVSIPSNMSILCTMNTSDQNVFTLDTAFQRRWNMRLIENKFPDDGSEDDFAKLPILDTEVTWQTFFTAINTLILKKNIRMTSSEDKRLGTHFVSPSDLKYDDYSGDNKDSIKKSNRQNSRFAEKVLKYLWDDAFKFNKDEIFDITKVNSLEQVITKFVLAKGNDRFNLIFKQNIIDDLIPKKQQ